MRQILIVAGWLALFGFLCLLILGVGLVLEFEYPYTFTLMGVRNAVSVDGVPVSSLIRSNSTYSKMHLHWHTCSYENGWCGKSSVIRAVTLSQTDTQGHTEKLLDVFAYSKLTHVLVPMTDMTAKHFPSLIPKDDRLVPVDVLDGSATAVGNGIGTFELPEKWFKAITKGKAGNPK